MARTFAMHAQQISGIKGGRLGWISKKKGNWWWKIIFKIESSDSDVVDVKKLKELLATSYIFL